MGYEADSDALDPRQAEWEELDEPTLRWTDSMKYAMDLRAQLGRKFTEKDVRNDMRLIDAVVDYLGQLTDDNGLDFLDNMHSNYVEEKDISDKQKKGILNCLWVVKDREGLTPIEPTKPHDGKSSRAFANEGVRIPTMPTGHYLVANPPGYASYHFVVETCKYRDRRSGTQIISRVDSRGRATEFGFIFDGVFEEWEKVPSKRVVKQAVATLLTNFCLCGKRYADTHHVCYSCGRTNPLELSGLCQRCAVNLPVLYGDMVPTLSEQLADNELALENEDSWNLAAVFGEDIDDVEPEVPDEDDYIDVDVDEED